MDKRLLLIIIGILLLNVSLGVTNVNEIKCCVNSDGCNVVNGGVGLDFCDSERSGTIDSVGWSTSACTAISACDIGCVNKSPTLRGEAYRIEAYEKSWNVATFVNKSSFKPTLTSFIDTCSVATLPNCESGACLPGPCNCSGVELSSTQFCGAGGFSYISQNLCFSSYSVSNSYVRYNFTFNVTSTTSLPLSGSQVTITSILYQGETQYKSPPSGSIVKNGAITSLTLTRNITNITYFATSSGYENHEGIYALTSQRYNYNNIPIQLTQAAVCFLNDKKDVTIEGCRMYQLCVEDPITRISRWSTSLTQYSNQGSACTSVKEFCSDDILDLNLNEECIPGTSLGEAGSCGVGLSCNSNCACEPNSFSGCVKDGVLSSTELCDLNKLNELTSSGGDLSLAFASTINYVSGMSCTEACVPIMPRTCGNGIFEQAYGEQCEFRSGTSGELISGSFCGAADCIASGDLACTCEVSNICGNGERDGSEECDVGSGHWGDFPNGAEEGTCRAGLGCDNTCNCEVPSCPSEINLEITDLNYTTFLNMSINLTTCDISNLLNLSLVYYKSESDTSSVPISSTPLLFTPYNKLSIPNNTNSIRYNANSFSSFEFNKEAGDLYFYQGIGELELENNTNYCFYLEGKYNTSLYPFLSPVINSEEKCITLGSSICAIKSPKTSFCHEGDAYTCSEGEVSEIISCNEATSPPEVCRVVEDVASCHEITQPEKCKNECGGLFGMYSFSPLNLYDGSMECMQQLLFNPDFKNICNLDYSSTPVDSFDSCHKINSCYDYQSNYSCTINACAEDDCEWVKTTQFSELGVGVCRPAEEYDCNKCQETDLDRNNKLLSTCSPRSCSSYGDTCFYNYGNSGLTNQLSTEENTILQCRDYDEMGCVFLNVTNGECNNYTSIGPRNSSLDEYNILTPSNDAINHGTCRVSSTTNKCIKDANNDLRDDCARYSRDDAAYRKCYRDNTPPTTSLEYSPYMNGNLNLEISIIDDSYSSNEIRTYCKLINSSLREKYIRPNSTNTECRVNSEGKLLINAINRLNGNYTLYFYSVDGSNNTEAVKNISFYLDTQSPRVTVTYSPVYFLDNRVYYEDGDYTFLARLTTNITVTDEPRKKINCGSVLYIDENLVWKEHFPHVSIKNRYYDYTGESEQKIGQFFNQLSMGDYMLNITCIDEVGNINNTQKNIELTDNSLYNFTPNSTDYHEPINISADSMFNATCALTNNSRLTYANYTSNPQKGVWVTEIDQSNKRKHYFNWSLVKSRFSLDRNNDNGFISPRYYLKCQVDEPIEGLNNLYIGSLNHYIQFAIDKTPPKVMMFSTENNEYIPVTDNWQYEPNMAIYAFDTNFYDSVGKQWASGIDNLSIKLQRKANLGSGYADVVFGFSNYPYYTCGAPHNGAGTPFSTSGMVRVCTPSLTDINTFSDKIGLYRIKYNAYDRAGNNNTNNYDVKVDSMNYTFNMTIDGLRGGMLGRNVYTIALTPSKNISGIAEIYDSDYNISLLGLNINKGPGNEYLATIFLEFNNGKFNGTLDLKDVEFRDINGNMLSFEAISIDYHNISTSGIINYDNFSVDTKLPALPVFTTVFRNQGEVQYIDQNGEEYPLYFYDGKYWTNQQSLFITGIGDVESNISFSWGRPDLNNDSVNLRDNLVDGFIGPYNILEEYSNGVKIENEDTIPPGYKYLEFVGSTRDSYGNYGKRYEILSAVEINDGYDLNITLAEEIEIDFGATSVRIWNTSIPQNYFGIELDIPNGCSDLYIKATDQNNNFIRLNNYISVCKDTLPPVVEPETTMPRAGSINSEIKNISVRFYDNNGIVSDSSYEPVLKNGSLALVINKLFPLNNDNRSLIIKSVNTIEGYFNISTRVYDYAHNYLDYKWKFLIDTDRPEEPSLYFDVNYSVSDDDYIYYLNTSPGEIYLNFTKEFNITVNYLDINCSPLNAPSLPCVNKALLENVNFKNYTINSTIDPLLVMDKEYNITINYTKIADDKNQTVNYTKLLVLDATKPNLVMDNPEKILIGIEYATTHTTYEFRVNVTNEKHPISHASLEIINLVSHDAFCSAIGNIYQCVYTLNLNELEDLTTYEYQFIVTDAAGNRETSDVQSIDVNKELPDISFSLNETEDLVNTSDSSYMVYPKTYVMNANSSKELNFTDLVVSFVIKDNAGEVIVDEIIEAEDITGEDDNTSFSFIFNISKYENILSPLNNIVGDISFAIKGYDSSGNYIDGHSLGNLMEYTGDKNLRIYSKEVNKPTIEPIFGYAGTQISGVQYIDSEGNEYPLYYYGGKYYTPEVGLLYITGYSDNIEHNISLIDSDGELLDSYTTFAPNITSVTNMHVANFNTDVGGKKGDNYFVLNGKINFAQSPYNYDFDKDEICVFFSGHQRTSFGNYHKGYKIVAPDLYSAQNTRINLSDSLEADVQGKTMSFVKGSCISEGNYFELAINMSEFNDEEVQLNIKDVDSFNQNSNTYGIGTVKKDTNEPNITTRNPIPNKIIITKNPSISFTICDDSPGILGIADPDGNYEGESSDLSITFSGQNAWDIKSYVSPADSISGDYCYNYTAISQSINGWNLGVGRHTIEIKVKDFAHNKLDTSYSFIVDPESPILDFFNLSESSDAVYHYNSRELFDIEFTTSSNPRMYIKFNDSMNLTMYFAKLMLVTLPDDFEENTIERGTIFTNDYNKLNSVNSNFSCEKMQGINYFNCSVNQNLEQGKIYHLQFKTNKTNERSVNVVSYPFDQYFVFDNQIDISIEDIDYNNVTKSKDVSFEITTEEDFGVRPSIILVDKDGVETSFELTSSQTEISTKSLWSVSNHGAQLLDADNSPTLASGPYTLKMTIYDYAGNNVSFNDLKIQLDDFSPEIELTGITAVLAKYIDINDADEDTYHQKVKIKKDTLNIVGHIEEDRYRGIIDTESIKIRLVDEDTQMISREFEFGRCDADCNFNVDVVANEAKGCICANNGLFAFSLESESIPGRAREEVENYIHLIAKDEASNTKTFRAYLLKDFEPPAKPGVSIN